MGIKITDTTLRDAHQSLLATRMRTSGCHPERSEGSQQPEVEPQRAAEILRYAQNDRSSFEA